MSVIRLWPGCTGHWWSVYYTAGGETVPGLAAAEAVVVRPATRTQQHPHYTIHRPVAATGDHDQLTLTPTSILMIPHQFNGKKISPILYPFPNFLEWLTHVLCEQLQMVSSSPHHDFTMVTSWFLVSTEAESPITCVRVRELVSLCYIVLYGRWLSN